MEGRQVSLRSLTGWAVPAALVVAALVFSALMGASGHAFLTTAARACAVALLFAVSRASVHMGHTWLVFARHDSIRNDIAAAGGLGQRLSV